MNNDFSKVKINDSLWSPTFGWMTVTEVNTVAIALITTNNEYSFYNKKGSSYNYPDSPQSLFFEEMELRPFTKPEVKTFDPNKPYCRRDGKPARIVCKDKKGSYPYVVLTSHYDTGDEYSYYTDSKGVAIPAFSSSYDLINIPEKIEGWVNVYPEIIYNSKYLADSSAFKHRIACGFISFKEGEGL